jgi:Na+-transporting NADH:ubiquinone oxidoreductase subunit F
MVCVGGGVGMAPLRAIIHQELGRGTGRRIRYFYGARSLADLFYAGEFETLSRHPRPVHLDPRPVRPGAGRPLDGRDRLHPRNPARRDAGHPAPEDCEYYLCGPPVMISAVLATLTRLGVEGSSIFYDDFGA